MVKKATKPTQMKPVKHDPATEAYIADLERRYGKYRLPLEELRKRVDAAMGDRMLSDVVIEDR